MTLENKNVSRARLLQRSYKITEQIKKHSESISEMFRSNFLKSKSGDLPPRGAIKAKCQECVGYEDTTDRIRTCSIWKCPLHSYRPYQTMENENE